jgi:allantoinase
VSDYDLVVRGTRVVLPEGIRPAAVAVRDGMIARIESYDAQLAASELVDAGEFVVLPGLVDTHVHVNDPGRAEWEGWDSATRAAAAGGITTIVDMPLNSFPPTTTLAGLEAKLHAAEGKAWVDYGLWGGAVPGNAGELPLLLRAGVLGFKGFLVPSGVDEFPPLAQDDLETALEALASHRAPLLVHAEDPDSLGPGALMRDPTSYASWLASRPPEAETRAVEKLIRLTQETGCRTHVVHVSAAESVDSIARARGRRLPVSAETCPHYLFFAAEEIPPKETPFKCAPPIRESRHRERLWSGLGAGILDLVVSDHSPCPPSMKRGDLATAWGGIASLQLSLAATWTGARIHGFGPVDVARWMSAGPARLAGIDDRKGAIAVGLHADLVVWDPDETCEVRQNDLHHRHRETPYLGFRLTGRVHATFVRGRRAYVADSFGESPAGIWIRGRADA